MKKSTFRMRMSLNVMISKIDNAFNVKVVVPIIPKWEETDAVAVMRDRNAVIFRDGREVAFKELSVEEILGVLFGLYETYGISIPFFKKSWE